MAVGWRQPSLVAKMSATLHALSGGRFVLGMGAGWRSEEFLAYGYKFPAASVPIRQLDEAVQIIYRNMDGNSAHRPRQVLRDRKRPLLASPFPSPPVMIGGTGEKLMLPLIARLADWWNVYPISVDDYKRKWGLLKKHLLATGRHPSEITQAFSIYNAKLPLTAEDSSGWLDRLQPLVDLGVKHFMIDFGNVTSTEPIERFAEEVISPINGQR